MTITYAGLADEPTEGIIWRIFWCGPSQSHRRPLLVHAVADIMLKPSTNRGWKVRQKALSWPSPVADGHDDRRR